MLNRLKSLKVWAGITLSALLVLAALLRLWGVNWPALHPDEWTTRIVSHFIEGNLYYTHKVIWHHLVFIVLALFYWPVNLVVSGVTWLLGPATDGQANMPLLIYGRVMIGLFGALNVWAVYRLFRRVKDSVSGGLMAAALVAVSPLLVAQSHYHTVDAPLALAVTFALWAALYMMQDGRPRAYLLAGLVFGLAVTTKVNAIIIIGSFGLAHILAILERKPGWLKWALAQPGLFLSGTVVGGLIGYPGIIFDHRSIIENIFFQADKWVKPRYGVTKSLIEGPIGDRLAWSLNTITDSIGWELVILFALGLGLALFKRNKAAWVVASFPFVYYFPYLIVANRMAERDMPCLVPSLAVLAALGLVMLSERWTPAKLRPWALGMVTLALMASPFMISARVGYVFWQGDTRHQARDWMMDNLPPQAVVYTGGYSPRDYDRRLAKYPHITSKPYRRPDTYLVHSAMQEDREYYVWTGNPRTRRGEFMSRLPELFQPVKRFDLKARGPADQRPGRRMFPIFISPDLTLYSSHPVRPVKQPLVLEHPSRRATQSYLMAYTNQAHYSLDDRVGVSPPRGRLIRVLRTPGPLDTVEVEVINLSHRIGNVSFCQGPIDRRSQELFPGQIWRMNLSPLNWPWFMERVYPFSLSVYPEVPISMRVISDPLLLGWRGLERSDWSQAAGHLRRARAAAPGALLPRALLAAALLEQGQAKPAAELLLGQDQALAELGRLASSDEPLDKWLGELGQFTGYYPDLLMNSLTRWFKFDYPLPGLVPGRTEEPGYSVITEPAEDEASPGSSTIIQLSELFPNRPLLAEVTLSWSGQIEAKDLQGARLALVCTGAGIGSQAFRVELKPEDLASPEGRKVVRITARPRDLADRWRLVLTVKGEKRLRVESLKMVVDPRALVRDAARWALLAQGRLLASAGEKNQAAAVLGRVASFAPGFPPALKYQVETLAEAGQTGPAIERLQKALAYLDLREGLLIWGRAMAAKLGAAEVAQAYQHKLDGFTAPDKVEAGFANGMRLAGYQISSRQAKPGDEIKLRLVWRFDRRPQRNRSIFTHLVGPGGQLNFDHFLARGALRMDRRGAGEVVVEDLVLKIPAQAKSGQYQLEVGLYWGKKRTRIVEGPGAGGDILRLGAVAVSK